MSTVNKSALIQYSAGQMFDLVNDIDAYPQFLPWCRSAGIVRQSADDLDARIEIAKGRVHKSFTTRNLLHYPERIDLQLLDGPFSRLQGSWQFQPLRDDACKVSLRLEFEFSNALLRAAIGPIFNYIADTMVDSFCKRARQVYG